MPTPRQAVRLDPSLLDSARDVLGLPRGARTSHVIRAALERLVNNPDSTGVVPVGRPPKRPAS